MDSNFGMDRTATDPVSPCNFMARTTLTQLIRSALLSTALVAGPASAALLDVVVTTNILSEVDMACK